MNNTNGEEYKSAVKKAVSGLNQALTLHYALEGLTADDYSSAEDIVNNIFKKRMNVLETKNKSFKSDYKVYICQFLAPECLYYSPHTSTSFITQDGILFYVNDEKSYCYNEYGQNCFGIAIDVNGLKGPNIPTISSEKPNDQYTVYLNKKINRIVIYPGPLDEIMTGSSQSGWNVRFYDGSIDR